jgi:hypothetical protein
VPARRVEGVPSTSEVQGSEARPLVARFPRTLGDVSRKFPTLTVLHSAVVEPRVLQKIGRVAVTADSIEERAIGRNLLKKVQAATGK